MPLPASLQGQLELPVIGARLFIVSGPELVAQCKAGIVGSFPALKGYSAARRGFRRASASALVAWRPDQSSRPARWPS
jgi:NAD(P)H-dependent flavin oxidoreductase YrpB (nitropropane dioxygenase family)